MDEAEILNKFLRSNINVHPLALEELKKGNTDTIEKIILKAQNAENKPDVLTLEYLESLALVGPKDLRLPDGIAPAFCEASEAPPEGIRHAPAGQQLAKDEEKKVVVETRRTRAVAEEYEAELLIKDERDITNKSFSEGSIEEFLEHFNNRYERLSKILRRRNHLKDAAAIGLVRRTKPRDTVQIIGMVGGIRNTKKGNVLIDLEDPTGALPVVIPASNEELFKLSSEIIKDEVLGVEGKLGNSGDILIASEVFFPDLPINREIKKSEAPLVLAIISDIHVGSTKFLESEFLQFVKWLNCEIGSAKQKALAERVKYLIVGGDLVDGVGIYPGQEDELVIKDINEQYKRVAELLSAVPDYIEIIILPGNHDAVRQAEPQPAISEEFASKLYENPQIHMAGNPCHTNLHGVDVLSYHGRSLDDIISTIPNLSYSKPEKAMHSLIKKRHLAPLYGGKVPLAPEKFDYMLIDEPPDIFNFGHVHTVGVENYRGTTLVNSGTFQEQTSFQRRLNMNPDPARVPIIDLQTQKTTLMRFM